MATYTNKEDIYTVIEHLTVIADDADYSQFSKIVGVLPGIAYTTSDVRNWERWLKEEYVSELSEGGLVRVVHPVVYCVNESDRIINVYRFEKEEFFASRPMDMVTDEEKVQDYFFNYLDEDMYNYASFEYLV